MFPRANQTQVAQYWSRSKMNSRVKTYKVRTKSYFHYYLVHETIDSSTSIVAFLSLKIAFQNRVRQNIIRDKGPSRVKQLFLVGFNYTQFSDSILGKYLLTFSLIPFKKQSATYLRNTQISL